MTAEPAGPSPVPGRPGPGAPSGTPRWLRVLDGAAGLLSAGLLVVGAVLLVAQLAAPALWATSDVGEATGPGWDAVAAHVAVGAAGEFVALLRRRPRRFPPIGVPAVAAAADAAVVAAAVVVLALSWWP